MVFLDDACQNSRFYQLDVYNTVRQSLIQCDRTVLWRYEESNSICFPVMVIQGTYTMIMAYLLNYEGGI